MIAPLVGALVGLLGGLAAEPLVRRLPARSPDAVPQADWIARLRRPPVLELVGLLAGAACGARFGLHGALAPALLLVLLLLPIAVIDLEHRVIPNAIVLPGSLAGLALGTLVAPGQAPELVGGAVLGFAVFLLLALASPGGMGLGDVKLMLMLGAFLGWRVVPAMMVGFVLAGLPAVAVLVRRGRAGRKVGLPFGPFLAAGAVAGLFWGDALIAAYLGSG